MISGVFPLTCFLSPWGEEDSIYFLGKYNYSNPPESHLLSRPQGHGQGRYSSVYAHLPDFVSIFCLGKS